MRKIFTLFLILTSLKIYCQPINNYGFGVESSVNECKLYIIIDDQFKDLAYQFGDSYIPENTKKITLENDLMKISNNQSQLNIKNLIDSNQNQILKNYRSDNKIFKSAKIFNASSSYNSWIGSSLAYNLDGKNPENIIGSAKVILNTSEKFSKGKFRLNIIGNIANFIGNIDTTVLRNNIRQIAQSSQGLSVGLEPLYFIKEDPNNSIYIRTWATLNYKANVFKNVEAGTTKEDITLSQFRTTIGIEMEAIKFSEGGKLLSLGLEGGMSIFDASLYEKIFKENRNKLFSLEWTFTLPIFGSLGLIVGQTYSTAAKPVFTAGVIVTTSTSTK